MSGIESLLNQLGQMFRRQTMQLEQSMGRIQSLEEQLSTAPEPTANPVPTVVEQTQVAGGTDMIEGGFDNRVPSTFRSPDFGGNMITPEPLQDFQPPPGFGVRGPAGPSQNFPSPLPGMNNMFLGRGSPFMPTPMPPREPLQRPPFGSVRGIGGMAGALNNFFGKRY